MTQSVELVLDEIADAAVRQEWRRLREAGLPSEERTRASDSHRPHLTLFAGDRIPAEAEVELAGLVAGLALELVIGAPLVFGPGRGGFVLVRQVVPSIALLDLQRRVAATCGASVGGQFGPEGWSPHVTLARRMTTEQVGAAVGLLARNEVLTTRMTRCRRWDSVAKRTWWLT